MGGVFTLEEARTLGNDVAHIVGVSGGKDSTTMALRLRAECPEIDFEYFLTPTGDELPDVIEHWARLEALLGKAFVRVTSGTLDGWIEKYNALPNHRQRWCTKLLKIQPCIAYLKSRAPALLYVGLRADEEDRPGIISADANNVFPLREWGMGIRDVIGYLNDRGITVPKRTDCARCFGQRIIEWKRLLRDYPAIYQDAEDQERRTGFTFRSPTRDTWPAPLGELRAAFESGRPVRGEDREDEAACRVCKL